MKQIRLCWRLGQPESRVEGNTVFGPWVQSTEDSRRDHLNVVAAGVRLWGEGAYWIQERERPTLPSRAHIAHTTPLQIGECNSVNCTERFYVGRSSTFIPRPP